MKIDIIKSLVVLFIILVVSFIWIHNKNDSLTNLEKSYIVKPVNQNNENRVWKSIDFKLLSFNNDLLNPLTIYSTIENNYLVVDYADKYIKEFNDEAKIINVFGEGRGRGPGEVINFMDVKIDPYGRIWATDSGNSRITIFDSDGQYNIYDFKIPISRAVPISKDNYFIKERFSSSPKIVNLHSDRVVNFPDITNDDRIWSNVLQFISAYDGRESIITALYYTNEIVKYNLDGTIAYIRRPIQAPPYPEILTPRRYSDDQVVFFNEVDFNSKIQRTVDLQIIDHQIHLLIDVFDDNINDRKRSFVDVYNIIDGDYKYSYHLPQGLVNFTISQYRLAGLPQDSVGIAIWEVKTEW